MYLSISIWALLTLFWDCIFRSQLPLEEWEGTALFLLAVVMTSVRVFLAAYTGPGTKALDECLWSECSFLPSPLPLPFRRAYGALGWAVRVQFLPAQLFSCPSSDTDTLFPLGAYLMWFTWGEPCLQSQTRDPDLGRVPLSMRMVSAAVDPWAKKSQSEHSQESEIASNTVATSHIKLLKFKLIKSK